MPRPIPTVEELVKIFKDNNWTPTQGAKGAEVKGIAAGKCCAIPALLKLADSLPSDLLEGGQILYNQVDSLYGEGASAIWQGFDDPTVYTEEKLSTFIGPAYAKRVPWIRLGRDLRYALCPEQLLTKDISNEKCKDGVPSSHS